MTNGGQPQDFEAVKRRLEEIADAVDDESLPLDDALDLFEEAVSLGLKVSDYIEEGIVVEDEDVQEAQPAGEGAGRQIGGEPEGEAVPSGVAASGSDGFARDAVASE